MPDDTTTRAVASVVVPAHDERAVIGRCLLALAAGTRPGELEVVVVANGCHDDTATVAKTVGADRDVTVLETPVAGKANAIRLGDERLGGHRGTFPRLYLDADSVLTGAAVLDMARTLTASGRPACAPRPEFDLEGASWPVRGFHRALHGLLGERHSLSGAGAYMLDAAGHRRVFPLPDDVLADDGWVHRTFRPDERTVVDTARVSVRLPRTVAALIRRRARVRLGNQQLDRLGRPPTEPPLRPAELTGLVRRREVAVTDAACFLAILLAERVIARWRTARGTGATWSPDLTTRT
jgi:glycosyltransferase involved in cell wall biosynthesis